MVSYRWFLGMIVMLTAARLVLVSADLPHTGISLFRTPSPTSSVPAPRTAPRQRVTAVQASRREGVILSLPARRGPALRYGVRNGAVMPDIAGVHASLTASA